MKLVLSVVALSASLTATGFAQAQQALGEPPSTASYSLGAERPSTGTRVAAPKNSFELHVGTGYSQPFGSLKSGVGMPSVASPGIGVELGLGYRIDPHFAIMWSGEFEEFTAERASTVRAYTGTVAFHYHIAPMERVDPWLSFGVGWRALQENPNIGPTVTTHGPKLMAMRFGIDFRASENASLGPVIGADATVFTFQDTSSVNTNIADPRLSTFVYAGLQGRFDVGSTTTSTHSSPPPPSVASR